MVTICGGLEIDSIFSHEEPSGNRITISEGDNLLMVIILKGSKLRITSTGFDGDLKEHVRFKKDGADLLVSVDLIVGEINLPLLGDLKGLPIEIVTPADLTLKMVLKDFKGNIEDIVQVDLNESLPVVVVDLSHLKE
jgi:hypothetical protein